MITVSRITDLALWDSFLADRPYSIFVQASPWGNFYESLGETSWVFGVYEEDVLIGGAQVVSTHAKRGDFLYMPYGPVIPVKNELAFNSLMKHLRDFAKQEGYDFIRVSPYMDNTPAVRDQFRSNGFRSAPMHVIAEHTWLLDLSDDEETLLANMKKNHRNLIRRCEREGVTVRMYTDEEALARLNSMHDVVAKRHKFVRFSRKYITEEFAQFVKDGNAAIFESTLPNGEVDASAIIIFFGSMACYRHSASLHLNNKLPSSYLIQWEVIKEAKRRGMAWYNFWGVAPVGSSKSHPFSGITHFKKGFGGEMKHLLHCHDLPITWKYWFNWTIETIRRYKRGF